MLGFEIVRLLLGGPKTPHGGYAADCLGIQSTFTDLEHTRGCSLIQQMVCRHRLLSVHDDPYYCKLGRRGSVERPPGCGVAAGT